jgi:hypothetical protein
MDYFLERGALRVGGGSRHGRNMVCGLDVIEERVECKAIFVGSGWRNKGILETKVIEGLRAFGKILLVGVADGVKDMWSGDMKEDSSIGDGGSVVFCGVKWSIGERRGLRSRLGRGEQFNGDM